MQAFEPDSSESEQEQMAECWERCMADGPLDSTKGRELLDQLTDSQLVNNDSATCGEYSIMNTHDHWEIISCVQLCIVQNYCVLWTLYVVRYSRNWKT